jgi:hypothetical protein
MSAVENGEQKRPLAKALSDPPLPEQAERFYGRLLERMKDLTDASRRDVYLLLLVAACMELLNRAAIVDVSLGPFKVSDISLVHKILPLVAGFLVYDLSTNGVRYLYTRKLANAVVEEYQPAFSAAGTYPRLTFPPASSLYGPLPWYQERIRIRPIVAMTAALRIGAITLPPLLMAWWFWRLFSVYGADDVLVWISVCVTAGFVVLAALVVLEAMAADMFRRGILLGTIQRWDAADRT